MLSLTQIREVIRAEGKIIITVFDRDSKQTEAKIHEVGQEVQNLRREMKQGFDTIGDQLQEVLQAASEITDEKLEKFRQKYFAATS